jgi:hypothetical protein
MWKGLFAAFATGTAAIDAANAVPIANERAFFLVAMGQISIT